MGGARRSLVAPPPSHHVSDIMTRMLVLKANEEFSASNSYMAAAFWFEFRGYSGIAKYLLKESDEERQHGIKIAQYIHKRGGKMSVMEVPAVAAQEEWQKASCVFKTLVDFEVQVEESLKRLHRIAREEGDTTTEVFLNDFLKAQIDEIDEMETLLSKVKAYEALPGLLWHLDLELK